ncbi:MAG: adenylosuccinate lyase [Rhodobacteraceae bacterium]|nr:MAG: adenylosuccinate lyase [Paracoccaceae bacterium]
MSIKVIVTSLALTLPASVALACSQHSQQTQSCGVGTIWDAEVQKCTKQVSG